MGNRTFRPQDVSPMVVLPLFFTPSRFAPMPSRFAPKPFPPVVVSPPMIEDGKVFAMVSLLF